MHLSCVICIIRSAASFIALIFSNFASIITFDAFIIISTFIFAIFTITISSFWPIRFYASSLHSIVSFFRITTSIFISLTSHLLSLTTHLIFSFGKIPRP